MFTILLLTFKLESIPTNISNNYQLSTIASIMREKTKEVKVGFYSDSLLLLIDNSSIKVK